QQATDQGAAERLAPWRNVQIWSIPRERILRHRGNAVAETGLRQARIAPPARGARSDISSGSPEMTVRPRNSPYAAYSHRPCRIRLAAKPRAVASQPATR